MRINIYKSYKYLLTAFPNPCVPVLNYIFRVGRPVPIYLQKKWIHQISNFYHLYTSRNSKNTPFINSLFLKARLKLPVLFGTS